jgi:hypothetical protein
MQRAFTEWVESILKNDTECIVYKNNFIEMCKYKCNAKSVFTLIEEIDDLEKIIIKYREKNKDPSTKLDFFYEISVFISKYKLNIRI